MNFNQHNHHPSNSIDDAAYPSDSNYSPGGHPSSSINNAAYPSDSSYRPSDPTMPTDDKLAMPNARYSQSYNTGPGNRQAPYPSYPANAQSPQGWARSPTHDPLLGASSPARGPITPWSPDGMSAANPNLPPPPPYDASRPGTGTNPSTPRDPVSPNPSEHALLGAQQSHQQQNAAHPPRPQSNYTPQSPAPAAAHVADATPGQGERGGPRTYLQSMTGGMPAYGNNPGQLGPVAQARRRRKMKLGILAGVLCAVLLFLVALVVGVLVGVVKVNNKDNKPPPQQGPPSF
ncbi:hypothetical protein ColTof4_01988 [Colletotrichum tofieldiae]|uniref:Uncharacterized protein n=2 Tax=Colletotrichum spaethianum species complex TaxID=2707349 RepID=A0A166MR72_9PEZI|nr:hypothetical protein CT0861_10268 [Colletotrichum tofieldiae]GJC82846.1 hypothetical protein ColLi_05684 [Colletotrichum liriopes]GKT62389.1 hypothetical protein ColTof3_09728 [Colletotrichum tofieldiae]GKT69565.1 hypothetical protein ColTof4_01988 [Colletotrichum tofieldiae]GKT96121.1 hypothetical protein Ct61P_13971 [Colletotrichum tofieldiae]